MARRICWTGKIAKKREMNIKQIYNPMIKKWIKIDFVIGKRVGKGKRTPYKNVPKIKRRK